MPVSTGNIVRSPIREPQPVLPAHASSRPGLDVPASRAPVRGTGRGPGRAIASRRDGLAEDCAIPLDGGDVPEAWQRTGARADAR